MNRLFVLFGLGLSVAPSIASAAETPVETAETAPEVFLANSLPRGEREYQQGETVVRIPLVWLVAAKVSKSIHFAVGERRKDLAAGSTLPLTLAWLSKDAKGPVRAYCTERQAAERKLDNPLLAGFNGIWTRKLLRSMSDAQFCLFDQNSDGKFDEWRLLGDGWEERAIAHPIEPIEFEVLKDAPKSVAFEGRDEFTIQIKGVHNKDIHFVIDILQQGSHRSFDFIRSGEFSSNRDVYLRGDKGFPVKGNIFGVDLEILSTDVKSHKIRINWPESADAERRMGVADDTNLIVKFSTY